ncbi:hypothetical protein GX50_00009 [[Emmonsia] crescens]|uniref:Uncharacterized protein n=1 Tax=[Emmonsia] crescens TaxID=73230 RepID=A0A2B7ZSL2_9EURO|nr:hypothetical protein GX50_00009 [Emmonsia crescens]
MEQEFLPAARHDVAGPGWFQSPAVLQHWKPLIEAMPLVQPESDYGTSRLAAWRVTAALDFPTILPRSPGGVYQKLSIETIDGTTSALRSEDNLAHFGLVQQASGPSAGLCSVFHSDFDKPCTPSNRVFPKVLGFLGVSPVPRTLPPSKQLRLDAPYLRDEVTQQGATPT